MKNSEVKAALKLFEETNTRSRTVSSNRNLNNQNLIESVPTNLENNAVAQTGNAQFVLQFQKRETSKIAAKVGPSH